MNRTEFQQIAEIRFREARSLMDAGFSDGAYYLAGYAVECALKACIAKRTQQYDFPDKRLAVESHTHNLAELLRLADLISALQSAARSDPRLQNQWITVREWSEAGRYQRWSVADAAKLIEAIENPSGGILPWIKQHW
jgi:HEPN domain-containing protein